MTREQHFIDWVHRTAEALEVSEDTVFELARQVAEKMQPDELVNLHELRMRIEALL
jgi:hypothetical protein